MTELIVILKDIILPIFIMIAIGYIMQLKFRLDLNTLAKLNIYFLVPGFMFVTLYTTEFDGSLFAFIVFFFMLFVLILYIISRLVARFLKLNRDKQTLFSNSVIFYNSGNYGIPVNDLVFQSDPFAMSIQVVAMAFQNIFLFSYGIFSLRSAQTGKLAALLGYFKMPVVYALIAGITFNVLNVSLPDFVFVPANYIADATIGVALVTLGAQVAKIKFVPGMWSVYLSLTIRLVIGPLVALGLIYLFRLEAVTAQALFIASAMPTSVNSAIIAQEYSDYPEFAAQTVLFSTLISAITVTVVIYCSRILF